MPPDAALGSAPARSIDIPDAGTALANLEDSQTSRPPRPSKPAQACKVDAASPGSLIPAAAAPPPAQSDYSPQPNSVSAETKIDIKGQTIALQLTYSNCAYCDISDAGSLMLLRFQQGKGHTIWSLDLAGDSKPGTQSLLGHASRCASRVSISPASPSLAFEARGHCQIVESRINTVTLRKAGMRAGGSIEGQIDAYLEHPESTVQMHLVASFQAQIPP